MDPLSAIASIFTLCEVGGEIRKGLGKLIKFKDAPQTLHELDEELTLLRCTVQDAAKIVSQSEEESYDKLLATFPLVVERLKKTLLNFESLISYELTTINTDNHQPRIDRSRWLRAEGKIQTMLARIQNDRQALTVALSLLIS